MERNVLLEEVGRIPIKYSVGTKENRKVFPSRRLEETLQRLLTLSCGEPTKRSHSAGRISPNAKVFISNTLWKVPTRKALIASCLLYHVAEEPMKSMIRIELESVAECTNYKLDILTFLQSKDFVFSYISRKLNGRSLFGNYLSYLRKLASSFRLIVWNQPEPQETVRRRGYATNGRTALSWMRQVRKVYPDLNCFERDLEQLAIEELREFDEAAFQWNISVLAGQGRRSEQEVAHS